MANQPHFDSWTILFLLSALHGFVLAFLLFRRQHGNKKANKILALILVLFAVSMTYYVAYWTGFANQYHWMNGWVATIPFLYGPLIYLYILVLSNIAIPEKYHYHYIPFLLYSVFMIPLLIRNIFGVVPFLRNYYFIPLGDLITYTNYIFIVLQCISLLIYGFLIVKRVKIEKGNLNSFATDEEANKYKWIQKVNLFYLVFSLVSISYWILVAFQLLKLEYDYAISVIMSVFIYVVGYMGFRQPAIFNEKILEEEISDREPEMDIAHISAKVPYSKSSLKMEQAKQIYAQLLLLMETEKPFLQNDLKIQDVATRLKISSHHLSQVVNELSGQNYPDLINGFRIREAQKFLSDPDNNDKILAIAFDSGFNNKATFNTAFKKITGMSPSQYRSSAKQKVVA